MLGTRPAETFFPIVSGEIAGVPCWFGPTNRPLFGWVHGPAALGAPAVVCCPPVGRDLVAAHRALRWLAATLAASGVLAVRFDYDGTGDSAGSDADPGRVGAWLESVAHAVRLARAQGAGRIGLVGLRSGAVLAEAAARRLGGVDALVLWDPFVSGKALIRHQRALQVLEAAALPMGAGEDELLGLQLGRKDVAELAALAPSLDDGPAAAAALVLHRPKDPALGRLIGRLPTASTMALPTTDHERFLDARPTERMLPEASLATAHEWLVETLAQPFGSASLAVPVPGSWGSSAAALVGEGPSGPVVERARRLGPSGLFAIETRPERPAPGLPVVVFLNAATDHHVGPSRLWVHLARRWADLGFRSVRMDLSGMGDSPTRPGRSEQVIRSADAFDDVREVVEAVGDPSNVVLVGLCSGGYQALESALDLRVRGVLAVNPAAVFTPPELVGGGSMDPRRRICQPTPTAAATYRRFMPSGLRRRLQPVMWRAFTVLRPRRRAGRWLVELVDGGVDTLVVCGEAESRQLVEGARHVWRRLEGSGRLRLEVIDHLDHALLPASHREEVAQRLTDHLVARHLDAQGGPPVRR